MKLSPDQRLSRSGLTPFLLSCRFGMHQFLTHSLQLKPELLNSHDDVRCIQYGMTGLMYAALGRQSRVCRVLREWKACLQQRNKWGKSALHFAAETGEMDLMEALSPSPELLNVKTDVPSIQLGETALDYASLACSHELY